jgi:hypothetical protein
MRLASRFGTVFVMLVMLLFTRSSIGMGSGIRSAYAAGTATAGANMHRMATDHRAMHHGAARQVAVADPRNEVTLPGSCGTHGCLGQPGGNCDMPRMPGGAPCCTAHCAAAPALAASAGLGVCPTPASTPQWGRFADLESAFATPDRPPPRG